MAEANNQNNFSPSQPLSARTNDPLSTMEGDSLPECYPPASEKVIRKTGSFQSLRYEWLSSDETFRSEIYSDSIYNAEPVPSEESLPECLRSSNATHTENSLSSERALSPTLSPRPPHSQWPVPQLSTIVEQNSIQTLRPSQSAPRLRPSPEKSPRFVHTKMSTHSIHPSIRPKRRNRGTGTTTLYQNRSFSANDLDAMLKHTVSMSADPRSSSTYGGTIDCAQLPQYPHQPNQTPPHRVPTPPGLPSFGSREAQTFRLTPTRPRSFWSRIWRRSTEVDDDQTRATISLASPPVSPPPLSPQMAPTTPSSELFKRTLAMIGMSRVVSFPSAASAAPRVSLPPGIHVSTTPGVLTQAEDGTFMRGRFYSRASGHGIGNRTLESHPLVRRTQSDRWSVIEEQVRAIDKACQRADRGAFYELQSIPSLERAGIRAEASRQSDTVSLNIPPTVTSHPSDVESEHLRRNIEIGSRLPSVIEEGREQVMLGARNEKPKERRIDWRRICYGMDCCRNFWFFWCCGCDPDPTDRHVGGVISERTLLYPQ
jgi:hypothetical protein